MPELPEVETVKQALVPVVTGQVIRTLRLARPDLRWPMPKGLSDKVEGREMGMPYRRGKYILLPVKNAGTLLIHLGMSGAIRIHSTQPDFGTHDHVAMQMSSGNWWVFRDPRRFGHLDFIAEEGMSDAPDALSSSVSPDTQADALASADQIDRIDTHWLLAGMGPEPLSNHFNALYLSEAARTRSMPIKTFLLDQKIVAGIGNIYACEALFRAGISPKRQARTVAGKRAEKLVPAIQSVLQDAIAQGGTSLRDHVQPGGEIGYFVQSLSVYGRAGDSCFTCGDMVKQIRQSGRSTFYCSSCQR